MKTSEYGYKFVEEIPSVLADDIIYVSTIYASAIHMCACGCGIKVVTPLSPNDWSIAFDGVSVGLTPSIGNWSFPCKSHYWIRHGKVTWSNQWSTERVEANREADRLRKEQSSERPSPPTPKRGPTRIKSWFQRKRP